jgi:hypothetical protein
MNPVLLSTAMLAVACGDGTDDPTTDPDAALAHHGSVPIGFLRAEHESASPYGGRHIVSVTLDYLECLVDFYAAEPQLRQDGPIGAPVFEDWVDRPCTVNDVACRILSIEQDLDASPPHLRVRYQIDTALEGRELGFGPLPDAELAGCVPIVRLGSPDAIYGEDPDGEVLWTLSSFNPDTAVTGQGQAIAVHAAVP